MIETLLTGLTAGAGALKTLSALIGKTKGTERAVLMELKGNIQLLRDYAEHHLPEEKVVKELATAQTEQALYSNMDFRKFQRRKLSDKLCAEEPWSRRYSGWETERLFENICLKVSSCQRLVRIGCEGTGINLKTRLRNLLRIMVLTARHIS